MAYKSQKQKRAIIGDKVSIIARQRALLHVFENVISQQKIQIDEQKNRIANLREAEKLLSFRVVRLEKRLRELEMVIPLSAI